MARPDLAYLYGLQRFGIKAGLDNIRILLDELGNPAWPAVHVAGTNGKGSTASMIAAALAAAGYRVGLYTSPHLVRFNERIRINGRMVSDEALERLTRRIRPAVDRLRATFFEATTAMAFRIFADERVDIAVIETGLGGRLDATNVITPLVSVITNVEIDHAEHLGRTHRRIAREKGGIIKPGVPCLTASPRRDVMEVLRSIARRRGARLENVLRNVDVTAVRTGIGGMTLDVRSRFWSLRELELPLAGFHQEANAALALETLGYLRRRFPVTERQLRHGFRDLRALSGLRGRLEIVRRDPLVVADVAHNPAAADRLAASLARLVGRRGVTVFGVMADKAYREMLGRLRQVTRILVAVQPRTSRALPAAAVAACYRDQGGRAVGAATVRAGLVAALAERRLGEPIIVSGSHYVVGEALELLDFLESDHYIDTSSREESRFSSL